MSFRFSAKSSIDLRQLLGIVAVATLLLTQSPLSVSEATTISSRGDRSGPSPKKLAQSILAEAEKCEEEGKLKEAEYHYRKLYFATRKRSFKKKYERLGQERLKEIVEKIEKTSEEDEWELIWMLQGAERLYPKNEEIAQAFKKLGYAKYNGRWVQEQSVESLKERDSNENRRRELRLNPKFHLIEVGPLNFYCDIDPKKGRSVLKQLINSNVTHLKAYREFYDVFALRDSSMLDIVLYSNHEDYMRLTKAAGTAGVYIPSLSAGFFFKSGGYNFPTMLHEMTHQYNDKLLEAGSQAWFEEGMSEYFGAGYLSKQGRRIKLGVPDGSRMMAFEEMLKGSDGAGYIPLHQFVEFTSAQLTSEFYSEAWALSHYLVEIHPLGRFVMFDYVASISGLSKALSDSEDDTWYAKSPTLKEALKKNGLRLSELEEGFLNYFRGYR